MLVLTALLLSSILLTARQAGGRRGHDADWNAPPTAAARTNPLANRPDAADGGKKIFAQRCSTCHGGGADGTAQAPSLIRAAIQRQSDGALFWKVSSGNPRTGMPTFSFLPPLQRWQLVLYLRAQADARGKTAADRSPLTLR
jgi:mono/diheme cytochrome c family protein